MKIPTLVRIALLAEWDRANPEPIVTIGRVADQIEHIAKIAGHAHVGIGTDFDGMGSFNIRGLADAEELPALFEELRRRGWPDGQLKSLGSESSSECFSKWKHKRLANPQWVESGLLWSKAGIGGKRTFGSDLQYRTWINFLSRVESGRWLVCPPLDPVSLMKSLCATETLWQSPLSQTTSTCLLP